MIDADAIPDAVIELDGDARIIEVNRAAATLCGASQESLAGRSLSDVLDPRGPDGESILRDGWHRSASLRSVSRIPEQALQVRGRGGDAVPANVTGTYRRDQSGRVTGAVLVLRPDGRHRDSGPAKSLEVISTVSHELRSPLTAVKGYTSLLLNRWERLGDEQKRTMLEQVHSDADRVTRLINELLDFSRLESGRLVLRRRLLDLPALASGVVDKVRMGHPEIQTTINFDDPFPEIYADADKVEQVLTNLVENAAKYGDPVDIVVTGRILDGQVSVSVSDRGGGIPPDDLRRVFTRFFRRAETRPTGLGLGLFISRGLVEAHGGRLDATSQVGVGSTFSFTLPEGLPEELAP